MKGSKIFFYTVTLLVCNNLKAQDPLPQPYVDSAPKGLIYNTEFNYKDQTFSGLMAFKKKGEVYHIILLSKFGPSIMDLTLVDNELNIEKLPNRMDKPAIRKLLEKDFNLILLTALKNPVNIKKRGKGIKVKGKTSIIIKLNREDQVSEARNTSAFYKAKASYYYRNGDVTPDEICLSHRFVKMRINMKLLENN